MEDSKTLRNLIGFTGLGLLATGHLVQYGWNVGPLLLAGGLLGLVSAFGLDFIERYRKPDLREQEAHQRLRRMLQTVDERSQNTMST